MQIDFLQLLRTKAAIIYDRLFDVYGTPNWPILPPLDELINTVISQNTNDKNRDIAFDRLRKRFPTWEDARDAPPHEVIECIRYAGLANQKGPRIQAILREVSKKSSSMDLDFLKDWSPAEIKSWLTSLNGVGQKTASIVMVFSLGIPAFPVDTHIYRVSGRLGLRPESMSVDGAHEHLAMLFAPDTYKTAHINLILFGRDICHARTPSCAKCFLQDQCIAPKIDN